MSLESLLTGSITVQTKTTSGSDSSLGEQATWADDPARTQIPALVQPCSARELLQFAQRQVKVSHKIYLATDPAIRPFERVRDETTQRYYRVVYQFNMAGQTRAWRLEAMEWGNSN